MRSEPELGNLRCITVSLNAEAAKAREVTWETLKRHHVHVCWHPQFVDFAVNRRPGASSLEAITGCTAFLRACQQFCKASSNGLEDLVITPALLLAANKDPRQSLLNCYLNSQLARVMGELNAKEMSESDREETKAKLKEVFFRNANRFQTASPAQADGSFRTYGYNAFQSSYIRSAWDSVIDDFLPVVSLSRAAPSVEEDEIPTDSIELECLAGFASSRGDDLAFLADCLAAGLRGALDDQLSWDVFYGMVYLDAKLSDLEETLGISRAYLSGTVNAAIVEKLRTSISDIYKPQDGRRIRITELRDPLLDFLPEDDFLHMVPRPAQECGRLQCKKAFTTRKVDRSFHR